MGMLASAFLDTLVLIAPSAVLIVIRWAQKVVRMRPASANQLTSEYLVKMLVLATHFTQSCVIL
jgi:hypothetical protein